MRIGPGLVLLAVAASACRGRTGAPVPVRDSAAVVERRMPDLPVYEISPRTDTLVLIPADPGRRDVLGAGNGRRVTLTTSGADARQLIVWLAQQAGISLVVSEDVNARLSVAFQDVLAVDALRAVMAEAGLSVLTGGPRAPWGPVVFYQLPVNVERATAEVIAARFGVSLDLARFIVESRPAP